MAPHDHAHHDHTHDHDDHAHADGGHDHGHGHHGHSHAPKDFGAAFAIGVVLNAGFVAAEVVYGLRIDSLALLADAGHNLSDVLGLLLAWGASVLVKRASSSRFTYGLRGTSILAALANATLLVLVTGAIAWEAVMRLAHPAPVEGGVVMAVAAVGIVVNLLTALLFISGRKDDLNVRAAFAHMAGDAAIAAGVVARPGGEPGDRDHRAGGDLGPVEGLGGAVAARRAARGRRPGRGTLAVRAARRGRGARPAHLGDEHDRERADGAPGLSRRLSGRRLPARHLRPAARRACDRARDDPGGDRAGRRRMSRRGAG
jgi:hypothetical protein